MHTLDPTADAPHPYHAPLTSYLASRFEDPAPVLAFVATRLLSADRPYGHDGPWAPLGEGEIVAGGMGAASDNLASPPPAGPLPDADTSTPALHLPGARELLELRIAQMFPVARRSFDLLRAMRERSEGGNDN